MITPQGTKTSQTKSYSRTETQYYNDNLTLQNQHNLKILKLFQILNMKQGETCRKFTTTNEMQ